jgi:NAD dependent epimerase/dehydratase family enzyme
MADEALMASERAVPKKLEAAGFQFSLPDIASALKVAVR